MGLCLEGQTGRTSLPNTRIQRVNVLLKLDQGINGLKVVIRGLNDQRREDNKVENDELKKEAGWCSKRQQSVN